MLITESNVAETLRLLERQKRLVVDTETNGLYVWHGARIIGVAVGIPPASRKRSFYFPFRHAGGGNLPIGRLRDLMRILSKVPVLTGWNSNKFDMHMLQADRLTVPAYGEDVMLMLHLLNENERFMGGSFELKVSANRYIEPTATQAQLALQHKLADLGYPKHEMWRLPAKDVAPYASDDVYYTEKLRELMYPDLVEWDLEDIWKEVNRYALLSRRMEERGLLLDVPLMRKYKAEAEVQIDRYTKKIRRMAGHDINLNSSKQLQQWLGVASTAKEVLEEMKGEGPETLTAYRQWFRVKSAYYEAYEQRMDADHVLHPNIKLHGTISGRPSAEDPNLQAVPRETDVYKVKDVFIARPGHALISADYSQMELRLGAHYAQDEFLVKAFQEGRNVHQMTADDLNIPYFASKQVNFAVLYGTGAPTLAKTSKRSLREAEDFLRRAHALHPHYRPLYRQIEKHAIKHKYIRLWTGRVRRFNMPKPEMWYHKALSNLIQGGVAEVMRHAILRLGETLPKSSHMLLQVHDQLLIETPKGDLAGVLRLVKDEMTRDFPFSVPFVVDAKVGNRWGTLKEAK